MGSEYRESQSSPERLAYWYFRLNGFLTMENLLVHPDQGSNIQTDVDILATRFNHRVENFKVQMEDDPQIAKCDTFTNVVLAEIKKDQCSLNGSWKDPQRKNMQRVIKFIGCVSEDEVECAAERLYETGRWSNDIATVRIFVLGETKCEELLVGLDQQIEWNSVINFCVKRFRMYRKQKAANVQWASDGIYLRDKALPKDLGSIRTYFGLDPQRSA